MVVVVTQAKLVDTQAKLVDTEVIQALKLVDFHNSRKAEDTHRKADFHPKLAATKQAAMVVVDINQPVRYVVYCALDLFESEKKDTKNYHFHLCCISIDRHAGCITRCWTYV